MRAVEYSRLDMFRNGNEVPPVREYFKAIEPAQKNE